MKTTTLFLLTPLCLVIAACSDDSNYDFDAEAPNRAAEFAAESASVASFDPAMQVFPFPNNIFFAESEDGTVNIPIAEGTPDSAAAPTVALNNMDGFSTIAPLTTPVTGTLDESSLVVGESIIVLELTTDETGTPTGVAGSLAAEDFDVVQYNGNIELRPIRPLKPKTLYAIYITDGVTNDRGQPLGSTVQYRLTRGQTPLTNPPFDALEPLRQGTRPFIDLFESAQIMRGEQPLTGINVAVSWTVLTQSTRDVLQAVADASGPTTLQVGTTGQNTSAFNEALPGKADVYFGTLTVPYYLTPANTPEEAALALTSFWKAADDNVVTRFRPLPAVVSSETLPVLMTVPNATSAMGGGTPANGWPIAIFQHGITRSRTDVLAVADAMADAGFAVIAIDMPMHGQTVSENNPFHADNTPSTDDRERTFGIDLLTVNEEGTITAQASDGSPDPSGQHFINLLDLTNSRDNLRQAAADLMVLSDSLDVIAGINVDTTRKAFLGHSLGAIVGTVLLSYDNSFASASLAMPGGGIARLLANSGSFSGQINGALAQSGIEVGTPEYEQFFTVVQTLVDSGDPINHAAFVADGTTPLHLMEVIGDATIPNIVGSAPLSGTEPLAAELGLTAVDMTVQGQSALVRFSIGSHGSILTPADGLETFIEMQTQVATFAATAGSTVLITDASVIQPADMPPTTETETETETEDWPMIGSRTWPVALGVLLTMLCFQLITPAHAAKRAGVELADTLSIAESELSLNGSGIRKKLFIKLYVGSLYLLEGNRDAAAIIAADEPMAIRLDILSGMLTRDKMIKALDEGFRNATGGDTAAIQPQIDQMLAGMQEKISPGDVYTLAYEPNVGTHLIRNGEEQLIIAGLPFKQALFGIWLSEKPAQTSLKSGLLGS